MILKQLNALNNFFDLKFLFFCAIEIGGSFPQRRERQMLKFIRQDIFRHFKETWFKQIIHVVKKLKS